MINWVLYKLYASNQTTFNFVISSKVEAQKNEGYSTSRCNGCHRIWWADLLSRMGHACKIFSYVLTDVNKRSKKTFFPVLISIFLFFSITEDAYRRWPRQMSLLLFCWRKYEAQSRRRYSCLQRKGRVSWFNFLSMFPKLPYLFVLLTTRCS